MHIEGERIRLTKWVHGAACVVRVEVDAVIPVDDPSEPCLEPETLRWLDQVQAWADAGNTEALARISGTVYVRQSA